MHKINVWGIIFILSCILFYVAGKYEMKTESDFYKENYQKITECQKELPRNQNCSLVAVVDNLKEK